MGKARVLVDIQGRPPRGFKKYVAFYGEKILTSLELPYNTELSVLLTDDNIMHALNKEHRHIDSTTDVLSFAMNEGDQLATPPASRKYLLLGDVVISVNRAKKQAEEQGHSIYKELALLVAHGILHLIGYDDVTDEELHVMEKLGNELVEKIGSLSDVK